MAVTHETGTDDAGAAKRTLRRELLAVRRGIDAEAVSAGSLAIVARLRALPELAGPVTVLLYAADPDEVTLDALVDDPPAHWRVLLPRVEDGDVAVVPVLPGAPLVRGHRGIREPSGAAVGADTVDVVVVPGVAFTAEGERLGRGAGMYDRLLPRTGGALRVGVCLERFVSDALPVETHDAPMDVLVTDAAVRRRSVTVGSDPA